MREHTTLARGEVEDKPSTFIPRLLAGLLGAQILLIALVFLPRLLPSQSQSGSLLDGLQASDIVKMTVSDMDGKAVTSTASITATVPLTPTAAPKP